MLVQKPQKTKSNISEGLSAGLRAYYILQELKIQRKLEINGGSCKKTTFMARLRKIFLL